MNTLFEEACYISKRFRAVLEPSRWGPSIQFVSLEEETKWVRADRVMISGAITQLIDQWIKEYGVSWTTLVTSDLSRVIAGGTRSSEKAVAEKVLKSAADSLRFDAISWGPEATPALRLASHGEATKSKNGLKST